MIKPFHDERIIQEARKQDSIGFTLLYYGLLMDLLYRQFILQEPMAKLWDLALLFFGVTFYMAGKRIFSGLAYELNQRTITKTVLQSFIAAIVFSSVNYWWFGNNSLLELLVASVVFFMFFCGITTLVLYMSKKKNDKMLKDD